VSPGNYTFVGRDAEIAALQTALDAATGGRGRLVVVHGPPGIGKSRMLEQFATTAVAGGARVLWGRCYEGEGAPPFWPWVQLLRAEARGHDAERLGALLGPGASDVAQLVPEVRSALADVSPLPVLDSPQARFRLFEAVTGFFERAAADAPRVLLLDDLHGADEPSLLLLEFVARALRDLRLLVVVTYRDVAAPPRLFQILREIERETGTERLALSGLSRDEVASFVEQSVGSSPPDRLVDDLCRRTEGNPLFLVEFVRALVVAGSPERARGVASVGVPRGVREVIGWHLAALSTSCLVVLRAGALLGRLFVVATLALVMGLTTAELLPALDEAVAAEVLTKEADGPGRYRFNHALLMEALNADLGDADRMVMHERAGNALAARVDADEHVAQIAHHFAEAARGGGDRARAVVYARRAADRALRLLAFEEAIRLYRLALDVLPGGSDDPRLRCELLLALGDAFNRAGEIEQARGSHLHAAEIARSLDSPELLAEAALGYGGEMAFPEGGYKDTTHVGLLEEALAGLHDDDGHLHARLLARLAIALFFVPEAAARRQELCTSATAIARSLNDSTTLSFVLYATHAAIWGPDTPRERLALATELLELARQMADRALAFRAHAWRCCDLLELDDVAGAARELDACAGLAGELRQPACSGQVQIFRATWAALEGRFEEAERLATDTLSSRWLGRAVEGIFGLQLYGMRVAQGRLDEMLDPIRALAALNPGIPAMRCGVAYMHARLGHEDDARAEVEQVLAAGIDALPRDTGFLRAICELGEACALIGDLERVDLIYRTVLPYAGLAVTIGNGVAYFGSFDRSLGIMAAALSRIDDAIRHFEAALASHARAGARPWLAFTQLDYASVLLAHGDTDRGRALLEECRTTARALDMQSVVARATTLLAEYETDIGRSTFDETGRPPPTHTPDSRVNVMRREGDAWLVIFDGTSVRLNDSRGLRYLALLIHHPGREFHSVEVVTAIGKHGADRAPSRLRAVIAEVQRGDLTISRLADADDEVDAQARASYRQRFAELREDLDEAEGNHDLGRAAHARDEIDALVRQLRGTGTPRRTAVAAERARLTVTKGIGSALDRIRECHPALAKHLAATVRRGYFCSYIPDPRSGIRWEA